MKVLEHLPRFNMQKKSRIMFPPLKLLIWILCFPAVFLHRVKLYRISTKNLKPPYLLLCNHNSFFDFKVATAAMFPYGANYVVAIDGFIGREWIMRLIGCICKRKFTQDLMLIKQLRHIVSKGQIAVLYPEARYSLCGTNAVLPDSLGKLVKLLKVPVATLISHGHHVNDPFWNTGDRKVKGLESTFQLLLTREQVESMSDDQIQSKIKDAFQYDDFAWQKEKKVKIKTKHRAEGLHKVLYQCASCKMEYQMDSQNHTLFCKNCGKTWEMNEYGELISTSGESVFTHIPDWYEWERENVRNEILSGNYHLESKVEIRSLPNSKGFVNLGTGTLTHNMDGFTLQGDYSEKNQKGQPFVEHWPAKSLYSCHIEYQYLKKYGDCVDLNTLQDTYYLFPEAKEYSVTKVALATEELYNFLTREKTKL